MHAGDAGHRKLITMTTISSALSHLECSRTGVRHDADVVQGVSAAGVPLLARYDVERAARTLTRESLAARPATLWRYREMLPVRDPARVVTLGEGMTPLLPLPRYGARIGVPGLLMKDEGLIPTGAFKARGAAVGVSRAAELGVTGVAMPTNGNAGAAGAADAAPAGGGAPIPMAGGPPGNTPRGGGGAGGRPDPGDGRIRAAGGP